MRTYLNQPDELAHYGVLGMKWGVRKNASAASVAKATSKAKNKMLKLDAKADKARKDALDMKYSRFYTTMEALNAQRAADRSAHKAYKWYEKSSEILGKKTMADLKNDKGVDLGKKYASWRLHELEPWRI